MSQTRPEEYARARGINAALRFIVRLYWEGRPPTPEEYVAHFWPILLRLLPFLWAIQIHNEPNHERGIEGWGKSVVQAADYNQWHLRVVRLLRANLKEVGREDVQLVFPGLAMPDFAHNTLNWMAACREAIEASDALGAHCYWQSGPDFSNHLSRDFGLFFQVCHEQFGKPIHILEAGNSNGQNSPPFVVDHAAYARQYREWLTEVQRHDYVLSACPFILSSPDPTWRDQGFTWVSEDNQLSPIVHAVAQVPRQVLLTPEPKPKPEPTPQPKPKPEKETTMLAGIDMSRHADLKPFAARLGRIAPIIEQTAGKYQLSPFVVAAIIIKESGGDPNAFNTSSDATGLMQVLPNTRFAGRPTIEQLKDPATNIDWGCRILRDNLAKGQDLKEGVYNYSGGIHYDTRPPGQRSEKVAWGLFEQKYWGPVTKSLRAFQALGSGPIFVHYPTTHFIERGGAGLFYMALHGAGDPNAGDVHQTAQYLRKNTAQVSSHEVVGYEGGVGWVYLMLDEKFGANTQGNSRLPDGSTGARANQRCYSIEAYQRGTEPMDEGTKKLLLDRAAFRLQRWGATRAQIIDQMRLIGHYEVDLAGKRCPGNSFFSQMGRVRQEMADRLHPVQAGQDIIRLINDGRWWTEEALRKGKAGDVEAAKQHLIAEALPRLYQVRKAVGTETIKKGAWWDEEAVRLLQAGVVAAALHALDNEALPRLYEVERLLKGLKVAA
jgi:hypothetical protein